jgi:hypothetical protein
VKLRSGVSAERHTPLERFYVSGFLPKAATALRWIDPVHGRF